MTKDLSVPGFTGRSITTPSISRQLKKTTEVTAAETETTFLTDAAHAFITRAAVGHMRGVLADVHEAVEDDPFGAEFYAPLVRGYASGAAARIERFGR